MTCCSGACTGCHTSADGQCRRRSARGAAITGTSRRNADTVQSPVRACRARLSSPAGLVPSRTNSTLGKSGWCRRHACCPGDSWSVICRRPATGAGTYVHEERWTAWRRRQRWTRSPHAQALPTVLRGPGRGSRRGRRRRRILRSDPKRPATPAGSGWLPRSWRCAACGRMPLRCRSTATRAWSLPAMWMAGRSRSGSCDGRGRAVVVWAWRRWGGGPLAVRRGVGGAGGGQRDDAVGEIGIGQVQVVVDVGHRCGYVVEDGADQCRTGGKL